MASLRSKLLIPTFMVSVLFIVAIAYIAIIQYEMFRQQTENIQWQGEKQLYVFIDEMQQQSRQFLDLLSNKWHFLDSVTMRNMDALLNEIMPFNKGLLNNFVTVYDMEGNIIAQAEDPGIFDKPDELHPHILKMKTGPVTQSIVAIYKDTLLVLELKRLENNYGAVGVLAVGNYITQKEVDEFVRLRQSHLILNYNNTPVVFSKGSSLPEDMSESIIQVKFEGNFGEKSPLTAFLYKDTSKMETAYWRNLIIIVFVLAALSSMVLFFAWRIVMGTVNALDDARMSSEKELVQRKQAESALNKLNVELENLVKERTEKLENEIFEHRLAEEDLEESRRLLDETAKISKTGGWEYDIQSHKATWTDEVYLIHEVPFDYDMNVEMGIAFYKQDDQSIIEHNFKKAIEDGEPYDLELQFTTAKGKHLWVRTVGNPVQENGKVIKIRGNIQDITERKCAEEELTKHREHLEELVKERTTELEDSNKEIRKSQQAMRYLLEDVNEARSNLQISNESLERANREMESFSYSVSHDLRSPLRAIFGFSSKLERRVGKTADGETLRLLSVISENSIKMQELISDLLNFSRIGRTEMKLEKINIQSLVSKICSTLMEEPEGSNPEFDILTLSDSSGSYPMIKQVFINLISNAVKFTRTVESPLITIGSQVSEAGTAYYVKDNGSGFDMKFSGKIFDIFTRLHNNSSIEGTGVGLAIVKQIIERHGGRVWVESEPGKGTTFYFTINDRSED